MQRLLSRTQDRKGDSGADPALRSLPHNLTQHPFLPALLLRGAPWPPKTWGFQVEGADPLGEKTGSAASPRCHQGQQVGGFEPAGLPKTVQKQMGKTQPWWEATCTSVLMHSAEIICWLLSTGRTHSYY